VFFAVCFWCWWFLGELWILADAIAAIWMLEKHDGDGKLVSMRRFCGVEFSHSILE
jgi:hypothetical protein